MADTSRKRSRKSKLVPRECPMYEDDLELQVPATKIPKNMKQKTNDLNKPVETISLVKSTPTDFERPEELCDTSVLKKINASVDNSIELDKTSPRKFEINIEVESCDDDDNLNELTKNSDKISPSAITSDVVENSNPILKSEEEKQTVPPRPIHLNLDGILEAVDRLQTSENIANKILSIYVRNTIGYEQKIKLEFGWLENQIQAALDIWRDWQSRSFHRGEPLFYKCYICIKSYWYLSDFRSHLFSVHPEDTKLYISVEKYETHECNLIAYHKELVVMQDIHAPGLCYRCGGDYAAHEIKSRYLKRYYKEDGCPRYFFCCTGLRAHFSSCTICNVQNKPFKCDICKTRFDTVNELSDHLVLSHLVRSDVPILTHYTNNKCLELEKYESEYLHNCAKNVLGENAECVHSLFNLPKNSIESHMKRLIGTYKCEICGLLMGYSCMKYEHMLSHTDEFMVVKKCTACEGLNVFVNSDEADTHWKLQHKVMNLKKEQNNFHKIFVPWSCVYQSLAKLDLNKQKSVVLQELTSEVEESTTEVQESTKELQESISEVQQSVGEEQESDVEEKPSLFGIDEDESALAHQFESTDYRIGDTIIKEEPQDSEDSIGLVIKEEPLEEDDQTFEEESETQNFDEQIKVKEELDDEIDEYDDLIKLNFNLGDLLVKEESREFDEETQGSENEYISEEASQDSMLEPKVVVTGKRKRKIYKCTCGFQSTHKEYRQHLNYSCTKHLMKLKNFKCTKCDNNFSSMKKFLEHYGEHGYPRVSCPDCLKQFDNFSSLGHHVQMHVRQNFVRVKMITCSGEEMARPDHQCTKCLARVDFPDFFDHWETHIRAEPSLPVNKVSKAKSKDVKSGQLNEAIMKECIACLYMTPKECNVCLRVFNRVNECKRHIIEHMLVDAYIQKQSYKELRCQICDSGFSLSDKYKKHMRDHASLPVYKCELCDRTFSDSSNFTKHKKVHNLKVIICDLCGKKFQSKLSLEKHLEKHKNTTPIPCTICNKVFYFESSYRRHVRSYHEKSSKEYRCVICSERFSCLKLKWDHMWEVHQERKQKADCPICHKSFRKYLDVRAHAKSVHMMAIKVIGIKSGKTQAVEKKRDVNTPKLYNSTWPTLTVGPETETLIVYDSD